MRACVYLVHDGGGRGLDAWLLVREGQLLQQVHVGQSILQGHVGRHGNKGSLTLHPRLTDRQEERGRERERSGRRAKREREREKDPHREIVEREMPEQHDNRRYYGNRLKRSFFYTA